MVELSTGGGQQVLQVGRRGGHSGIWFHHSRNQDLIDLVHKPFNWVFDQILTAHQTGNYRALSWPKLPSIFRPR